MAAYYFPYLVIIIVLFIEETKTINLNFKMPGEDKNVTLQSHLQFESVKNYCSHRDDVCRSNDTHVCGVKMVDQKKSYKDFANGCYLFLSNMCDHPEEEYFIAAAGSCEQYLTIRRDEEPEDVQTASAADEAGNNTNSTESSFGDNDTATDAGALRQKKTTPFKPLYDIDTSFDYHVCPHSCPKTYAPECVNINRGEGKYFKMLTFVNHCSIDLYYCKNWIEFAGPPGEGESISTSPLAWSFCGAHRYMQFARFSEAASSMGHFGWLAGDYKYSHIMEPHERLPGYG